MCYEEYIAYQCGHRSLGVTRPCPMTTNGHNYPVCTIQPSKQYNAYTMCGACERLLHSRWVLIREWEHRWLHERGACGCEVKFPGLLTQPRVIGDSDGGIGQNKEGVGPQQSQQSSMSSTIRGGPNPPSSTIPPLFAETTDGTERRVTIRLPGLYAAEWVSDHRALHQHKPGEPPQCSCPAYFGAFQPTVEENDMTEEERAMLYEFRDLATKSPVLDSNDINHRIAQIQSTFGTFSPFVPVDGGTYAASGQQEATQPRRMPHQAPVILQTQQRHPLVATSQYQSPSGVSNSGYIGNINFNTTAGIDYPIALAGFPTWNPQQTTHTLLPTSQDHQHQHQWQQQQQQTWANQGATTTADVGGYGTSTGSSMPFPSTNVNPNYNNQDTTATTSIPTISYGPGPYTTSGLTFMPTLRAGNNNNEDSEDQNNEDSEDQNNEDSEDQVLEGEQENDEDFDDTNSDNVRPLPICGVPIGAGPEGESHMPGWHNCRLSRAQPRRRNSIS
ncbi:hypothetical protein B0T17DRAFT_250538 [Bombardia bombarda]|uniref:Uncharacterized protein n=1 Tax=Bombardia bombarda TaxID=252184 RepID=A0AA39WZV8_9PEZI|nr:hypothetical protein B0T17DRAFT_250538 [Bombardia bombarda]